MTKLNAEQVSAYLKAHPDFFQHQAALLDELKIPHPLEADNMVSLLEIQLLRLQNQQRYFQQEFKELVSIARENELLTSKIHLLALQLLECQDAADIIHYTEAIMQEVFEVEFIAFKFSPTTNNNAQLASNRYDKDIEKVFHHLIRLGQPKVGTLSMKESLCLFDESEAAQIASAVLIPIREADWTGVLAIGSQSALRYQAKHGLIFLNRIKELVSSSFRQLSFSSTEIKALTPTTRPKNKVIPN